MNRRDITEGGCLLCKPRASRFKKGLEHPRKHYLIEKLASG